VNPYETAISIVTGTPGTADVTQGRRDAVDDTDQTQHLWWCDALRTGVGHKVLSELNILPTPEGRLPEEWEARSLAEPNDRDPEAAISVTVAVLREAVHARAGVMFLERHSTAPLGVGRRHEWHLCAIDPGGGRAALMLVC
jgi:hypothetical protein